MHSDRGSSKMVKGTMAARNLAHLKTSKNENYDKTEKAFSLIGISNMVRGTMASRNLANLKTSKNWKLEKKTKTESAFNF